MMYQDVKAHLDAVSVLLKDIETTDCRTEALHSYATIMILCKDLRRSAQEYRATNNITGVINEVEGHAAAMVGLTPSWALPMSQHLGHAHNALHKLTFPTCFNQSQTNEEQTQ
jgi:hypothetical protein